MALVDLLIHENHKSMVKQAYAAFHVGKYEDAAKIYLQLSQQLESGTAKINVLEHMACCYEKASCPKEAAFEYLNVAQQYIKAQLGKQAIHCLEKCRRLSGAYHAEVKKLVLQLIEQGFEQPCLSDFLNDENVLYEKLIENRFFSAIRHQESLCEVRALTGTCILKKGEALVQMADEAREMYYIISGCLEASMTFDNRRDSLGMMHAGEFCGEITYFTGGRRTAELVATTDIELLVMPFASLAKLQAILPCLKGHMEQLYRERILLKQLALAPVFSSLDALTWKFVAQHMSHVELQAGQALFNCGDQSADVFLVRSGHLNVTVMLEDEEVPLHTVSRGDVVGEIAVMHHHKRELTARAMTRCSLMVLQENFYQEIFSKELELQWILSQRYRLFVKNIKKKSEQKALSSPQLDRVESSILDDIWREDDI
ncbi:MAG: cyclic nucleotide-binding domain-containing protein [Mariprofundaceae bacterium]|nr:cyclic nucleotide-binding domain-containing protein [Mariprofundaceae bacterium]